MCHITTEDPPVEHHTSVRLASKLVPKSQTQVEARFRHSEASYVPSRDSAKNFEVTRVAGEYESSVEHHVVAERLVQPHIAEDGL